MLNRDLTKNQRQIDYLLAEQNKLTDRKEVLEREINSRKKVQITADVDPKWNTDGKLFVLKVSDRGHVRRES